MTRMNQSRCVDKAGNRRARSGWFAAKIEFRSSVSGQRMGLSLWDEDIVIILATDDAEARKKATKLGKRKEHSYKNVHGDLVSWHFEGVTETLSLIDVKVGDGTEVFYRFFYRRTKKRMQSHGKPGGQSRRGDRS